jgi:16S rRNA (uracil1498-N3)-methyltransferase
MERNVRIPAKLVSSVRPGAIVTVPVDGEGEYRGRVVESTGDEVIVRLFEELPFVTESRLHICLIQAVPTKEKMAFIIQKATELGVNRITPCISARSTPVGRPAAQQDKSHRWDAVAEKAVQQCRRRGAPLLDDVCSFPQAVERFADFDGARLMLYEKEAKVRLKDLASADMPMERVVVACGPEGGFTDEEVAFARERGFVAVRLGGRILRCETAALAALSIIQFEWGDL